MEQRDLLTEKLEFFYKDIQPKRKKKKLRLQVNQDFQKNKVKELNKRYNLKKKNNNNNKRRKSIFCRAKDKRTKKREYQG